MKLLLILIIASNYIFSQIEDDIIQIQEFLFKEKPDFIVETGVAHGGSIIFYSSICKLLKKGKVIGIDIKIRKKNRKLLENSNLKKYFQLIESSSTSLKTILRITAAAIPQKIIFFL